MDFLSWTDCVENRSVTVNPLQISPFATNHKRVHLQGP